MAWDPLRRVGIEVVGVRPGRPALLDIRLRLSAVPPPSWSHWYTRPRDFDVPTGLHRPRVAGARIEAAIPDDRLLADLGHLDDRLAAANAWFQTVELPLLDAEQARADAAAAEEAQRLADAELVVDAYEEPAA